MMYPVQETLSGPRAIGVPYPCQLNVGSGNVRLRDGYVTLDANSRHEPQILFHVPPIPLADESCETVYASHFIEHLTKDEASEFIAEAWRVLIPGGTLDIVTPYAFTHGAVQDPTHKSYYVPESFLYYSDHFAYLDYGLETRFTVLGSGIQEGNVVAMLRKETP